MRKSYIREKRTLCGDTYQAVGIYPVTDQEHRQRGKKRKESDKGQKSRNKAASLRRRLRKVLANFDQNGFYLTATYEDAYLPEDEEGCWRDVRNYARRVQRAARKRFGVRGTWLKLMLWAVRNGEAGRLHMHGFAQCPGLSEAERRELRYMLEDLWRRRVPGTLEFEPMGTINADRIIMKKILGIDGQGTSGTVGYIYGHSFRRCLETSNLTLPEEQPAADTKWSRRQLREACSEHAEDPAWWEKQFPGWECVKIQIFDPGGLHENAEPRPEGWEATEPQAYVILRREFAKVRT